MNNSWMLKKIDLKGEKLKDFKVMKLIMNCKLNKLKFTTS